MDAYKKRLKEQASLLLVTLQSLFWISFGTGLSALTAYILLKNLPPSFMPLSLLLSFFGILFGMWMNQASLSFSLSTYYKGEKCTKGYVYESFKKVSSQFITQEIDCVLLENSPLGKNIFVSGFFPFKPKVFIEKSILPDLNRSDFEAIFAHEFSHIHLNHLKEKNLFLLKTIMITLFFTGCILMGLRLMGLTHGLEIASLTTALIPIIFCQVGCKNLNVEQEFEADYLASLVLKNGSKKLSHALSQMLSIQQQKTSLFMEERLKRLAA